MSFHFSTNKQDIETLRQKHIQETENIAQKQRFGLFSQPPSINIGDDSNIHKFQNSTQPKQILTSTFPKGKKEFSQPGYITIDDFYKDPFREKQEYQKEKFDKIPFDVPFKPTDNQKTIVKAPYEHMNSSERFKQSVRQQKNFYTNPSKKGLGNTTSGIVFQQNKYISDPYERKQQQEQQEQIKMKAKVIDQQRPFKSNSTSNTFFSSLRQTYGNDIKDLKQSKQKIYHFKKAYHPVPFRPNNPSKEGYNKTFQKFPQYLEDPPTQKKDVQQIKKDMYQSSQAMKWRPNTTVNLTRPSSAMKTINTFKMGNLSYSIKHR